MTSFLSVVFSAACARCIICYRLYSIYILFMNSIEIIVCHIKFFFRLMKEKNEIIGAVSLILSDVISFLLYFNRIHMYTYVKLDRIELYPFVHFFFAQTYFERILMLCLFIVLFYLHLCFSLKLLTTCLVNIFNSCRLTHTHTLNWEQSVYLSAGFVCNIP